MIRLPVTIKWRLVLSFAVISIVSIAVMGSLSMAVIERLVDRRERDMLRENAAVIATQSKSYFFPLPNTMRLQHIAETSALMGDMRVWILDPNMKIIADSGRGNDSQFIWAFPSLGNQGLSAAMLIMPGRSRFYGFDRFRDEMYRRFGLEPEVRGVIVQRGLLGSRLSFGHGIGPVRGQQGEPTNGSEPAVTVPIGNPARPVGYVQIGSGPGVVHEIHRGLRDTFFLAGIVTTAIAAVIGLILGRRMTAPISSLIAASRRMGEGDLSARAPEIGKGEIYQLSNAFNTMASRLGTTIKELRHERDVLRRFVADASHELRTPQTALRTFLELMGKHPEDVQMQSEFLSESLQQIERMEWITSNLLDIARLEGGVAVLSTRSIAIDRVAFSAIAPLRQRAEDRSVKLELVTYDSAWVSGDSRSLEVVIGNLVQNAIDWTAPGTEVVVEVRQKGGLVVLSVTDYGPGISSEDLPHIFKRFFRSNHAPEGGSGLGLSIARAHIEAHGGTIRGENHVRGARFTIELPLGESTS